jgi:hypothetical protein
MASTWSALKIELLETGQNSGQWGNLTNVNLGDAVLGEAITGSATVDFATDADVTITLTDSAASQSARNLRLNITESSSGIGSVRNLILGSGCQIEKFYLINNTGTGAKTVKNTSGTGISVPAGKATLVFNDGTNVVDAASYFTSLTLGSALPIASGGTGTTSTTFTNLATNVTGTLPVGNGGTGITSFGSGVATFLGTPSSANLAAAVTDETGSGSLVFATSPTLVTPALGTPSALVGTNITGTASGLTAGNVTTNANLTGAVTSVGNATSLGSFSSANLLAALTDETGTGSAVFATSPTLVTPNLGTPTTLVLSSATGLPLSSGVTGILPVANGGTATATPALVQGTGVTITGTWPNQTISATGTGGTVTSVNVSGGTTGLTTSGGPVSTSGTITLAGTLAVANGGTGITSLGAGVATFLGTPSSANLASAVTDETGTGALVFATSPTLVTPLLGTPTSGVLSACTVDGTDAVGFRNIPQNSQSAAYTLVLADAGKHIFHPVGDNNARTFTIPANSSVAYPIGTAITFINMAVANVTIAITTDTLTLSPAGTTGSRTLATNGSATCIKITSTSWLISGSGLT